MDLLSIGPLHTLTFVLKWWVYQNYYFMWFTMRTTDTRTMIDWAGLLSHHPTCNVRKCVNVCVCVAIDINSRTCFLVHTFALRAFGVWPSIWRLPQIVKLGNGLKVTSDCSCISIGKSLNCHHQIQIGCNVSMVENPVPKSAFLRPRIDVFELRFSVCLYREREHT